MIKTYYKSEYNLVSNVWKHIALSLICVELIITAVLLTTYYDRGDLGELYFDFGDKLLMVGVFTK